ncbi:MAG: glycosyltransferase family 2 protein [Candidatus Zixiibacteriota bacterium]
MNLSIIIIAKNEEKNLVRSLTAVQGMGEIILVDSGSTDNTRAVAERFGAQVFDMGWNGFGPAKKFAQQKANGSWILSIDADEVVTAPLREEILTVVGSDNAKAGYEITRLTNFMGKWIYHSGWYPDYVLRLFRREVGLFSDSLVHESVTVSGPVGRLNNTLLHYSYPDISVYLRKLDRYTSLGAEELRRQGREFHIHNLLLKPPASFFRHYLTGAGFLDGLEGFLIAGLSAYGTFIKYAKLKTLGAADKPS